MAEELLDCIAALDENGQPLLGDCTLLLGDGTRVEFTNGRAKAPRDVALVLNNRSDVLVPAIGTDTAPPPAEEAPPRESERTGDPTTLEQAAAKPDLSGDADAIEAAKAHLEEENEEVPETETPVPEPSEEPEATPHPEGETEEPETDPSQPPPLPEGFTAYLDDGERRCVAAKGDGTQCSNAAKDGWACGLQKHQEAVSA